MIKISNLSSSNNEKKPGLEDSEKPTPSLEPDSYNGAVTDKYSWAQMHRDLDVKVPVPTFVKKSKDIEVKITSHKLWIALKQDPPPGKSNFVNISEVLQWTI